MPMVMSRARLVESGTFCGRLFSATSQEACFAEHAVDRRVTDGHEARIEHHVGESSVPIKRIVEVELDNCIAFPVLNPVISRDRTVMFIVFPIMATPFIVG